MRQIKTCWTILEDVFREHAHSRYRALRPPASAASLTYLERVIGQPIPNPLRRSLLIHDGMRDHQFNGFFNGSGLLPARAIARTWRMRCEVHQTTDPGGPNDADPRIKRDHWWRPGWLPITDENGNMHVIDLDPAPGGKVGQVFLFRNSGGGRQVIAADYNQWLDHIAGLYHDRKFRFNQNGHLWMDDQNFFAGADQ